MTATGIYTISLGEGQVWKVSPDMDIRVAYDSDALDTRYFKISKGSVGPVFTLPIEEDTLLYMKSDDGATAGTVYSWIIG